MSVASAGSSFDLIEEQEYSRSMMSAASSSIVTSSFTADDPGDPDFVYDPLDISSESSGHRNTTGTRAPRVGNERNRNTREPRMGRRRVLQARRPFRRQELSGTIIPEPNTRQRESAARGLRIINALLGEENKATFKV